MNIRVTALLLLSPIVTAAPSHVQTNLVSQLGHNSHVYAVAISPDGALAITGSEDQTARLWETATGAELRTFAGHVREVRAVAFSPDGRRVLTGSRDETVRMWDVATGAELRRFAAGRGGANGVAFSPDGRSIAAASWDFRTRVFDAATGEVTATFSGHQGGVLAVAWSSDGRFLATASYDQTAKLWEVGSAREVRTFAAHREPVLAVALSRDGRYLLTGSMDDSARLWDVATGAELHVVTHANDVTSLAFAGDGRSFVTASFDKTARVWDAQSGARLRELAGHTHWLSSVAVSSDGRQIVTGSHDRSAKLWDAATGEPLAALAGRINLLWSAAFSPDGRFIVTANRDGTARLWEGTTGEQAFAYSGHQHWVTSAAFSPDGATLITGSWDASVRLWDAASGAELRALYGLGEPVTSVAFSSDGSRIVAGGLERAAKTWEAKSGAELHAMQSRGEPGDSAAISADGRLIATCRGGRAVLWDSATGAEVRELAGHVEMLEVRAVAFSPDGKHLLTGGGDATAKLWDVASGIELRTFRGHPESETVDAVAFTPDGRFILTASSDQTAKVWDASTGAELRTLTGHRGLIHTVSVSNDGRFVLTSSADGTARLWEFATGRLLCSLVSFQDGGWAVIDPEGRFDAANGGDVAGLHWVAGTDPISLAQLKERYYVPALLARILGFDARPLEQVTSLDRVALFPTVRVDRPADGGTKLTIRLTDRGGGIGRVRVLVNRKELLADARGSNHDPNARQSTITVDLAGAPALPGEPNHIEVIAWNRDEYLSSRGVILPWSPPAGEKYEPELYAIVAGISEYAAPRMKLRFAAKDAVDMASAIELAAGRLFGPGRVHVTLLASSSDARAVDPTKDNFRKAFERARNAKPGDVLVVYLAGHGVAVGGEQKLYAYFTREAQGFDLSDPELRSRRAITSDELTEWVKQIQALKQVMILDTCAAGAAASKLTERRAMPGDQVRALERLKDRTGLHVLMGSAADAVSYEASRYGQGLLTYTLLEGLRGAAVPDDSVDVGRWFGYAAERVPQLARDIGGIQRPQIAAPSGSSFPIGIVGPEEKKKILVPMPRPLVLRPILIDPDESDDHLQLSIALRKALDVHAYSSPRFVSVDADELPGAVRIGGVYRVRNDRVKVSATLRRDDERLATVEVDGATASIAELAERLAKQIAEALPPPSPDTP